MKKNGLFQLDEMDPTADVITEFAYHVGSSEPGEVENDVDLVITARDKRVDADSDLWRALELLDLVE